VAFPAGLEVAPVLEDEPPPLLQALLEEARQTYSLGKLPLADVTGSRDQWAMNSITCVTALTMNMVVKTS
jgi:hypothetical protein